VLRRPDDGNNFGAGKDEITFLPRFSVSSREKVIIENWSLLDTETATFREKGIRLLQRWFIVDCETVVQIFERLFSTGF
jgi:hypothetical protein